MNKSAFIYRFVKEKYRPKNVQMQTFFWSIIIQSKYEKHGPQKTSILDTFHAVRKSWITSVFE